MPPTVLVVEDDPDIARLVSLHLGDAGFEVRLAGDGTAGLAEARNRRPNLVVLDLMLPGTNGLDVCRALRARPPHVPILMLTARSTEVDRVVGLEIGADDYLTKPFSVRELVARARALVRRVEAIAAEVAPPPVIEAAGLVVDVGRREVTVEGRAVVLTAREFDLLSHFVRHPGRVFTRSHLLEQVWGYGHEGYDHTVNSHINRLRAKIERDPSRPCRIVTVWGVGYKLVSAEAEP